MRTRTFSKRIAVIAELMAGLPKNRLEAYVRGQLEADFDEQRGPRGGRYVAAGPIEMRAYQTADDWWHFLTTYEATRPMRYVRPTR